MDSASDARWDKSRLVLQAVLLFWSLLLCVCLFWSLIIRVPPWNVPRTMYTDTFGPMDNLWRFEPPLMDRARYETPGNIWRPVMFKQEQWLGWLQDSAYRVWNWGARALWLGPMHMRVIALMATAAINIPFYVSMMELFAIFVPLQDMVNWYVCHMPEELLTLAQLDFARQDYSRKLSIKYMIIFSKYYAGRGA